MTGERMSETLQFPSDHYVVDVGMHDGTDSEYYARRGFRVLAFDANPELAEAGQRKFQKLGLPVEVRNRAISNTSSEEVTFFVNRHEKAWSSLNKDLGSRGSGSDEIQVKTADLGQELLAIADRIHMLKIDIEGYDLIALKQLDAAGVRPKYCSVENGGISFLEVFLQMGYRRFKLANQKYNHFMVVPKNSVHGNALDWVFARHSSGPFGNDIPSGWMTADRMREVLVGIDAGRKAIGTSNLWAEAIGWFDMHAALDA
jgi:FkbM family methyltransferase